MRLISIQPIVIYNKIMRTGVYKPRLERSQFYKYDSFVGAYKWLIERMKEKIGKPPEGVTAPVWAWHTLHKNATYRGCGFKSDLVRMVIEVPNDEVLLTDTIKWNSILADSRVPTDGNSWEEIEWYHGLGEEEKVSVKLFSWHKVFNINDANEIQATFWTLRREQILDARWLKPIKEFKGAS